MLRNTLSTIGEPAWPNVAGYKLHRRGLLVLLASPVLLAQAAAPVFPPGSAVGLVPPPGMRLATGFSGFQDTAAAASILIASLPAEAYAELSTADDAKFEQAQGIRIERRQALQAGGAPAVLLSGTQTVRGVEYRKWVLIAGAPALTALVTVQVPADAAAKYPDAVVEAALASVAFRAAPPQGDALAALPFVVRDLAGFRVSRVLSGNVLGLTEGPLDVDPDSTQPLVVIAWVRQPAVPPGLRDNYARRSLAVARMLAPTVSAGAVLHGAGGDWLVLEATGPDVGSNREMYAYQALHFGRDSVMQVVGLVRAEERAGFAPRFRQVAASVRMR